MKKTKNKKNKGFPKTEAREKAKFHFSDQLETYFLSSSAMEIRTQEEKLDIIFGPSKKKR